ncbi:hypothetical protein [Corynebacterium ulcerans]|nr:hypothetical protein [Corynebacterium ulcerans]
MPTASTELHEDHVISTTRSSLSVHDKEIMRGLVVGEPTQSMNDGTCPGARRGGEGERKGSLVTVVLESELLRCWGTRVDGDVVTLAVKRALVAVAIFLGESTWEAGVHANEERQKPAAIRE